MLHHIDLAVLRPYKLHLILGGYAAKLRGALKAAVGLSIGLKPQSFHNLS